MVCGKCPFKGSHEYLTFQKIIKLEYTIPEEFPDVAKSFIEKLLVLDPLKRFTDERYLDLKSCDLFQGIDFEKLYETDAPELRPSQMVCKPKPSPYEEW
jgi:3-phosphoinositide dependent protein kinase-1